MIWLAFAWVALTAFYAGRFWQWWLVNFYPAWKLRRFLSAQRRANHFDDNF